MYVRYVMLAIAVAGGAGFLVWSQRRQHSELERAQSQIAALTGSVEETRHDVAAARSDQRVIERALVAKPQSPSVSSESVPAPSLQPGPTRKPPSAEEVAERVISSFEREAADAQWSGNARQLARDRIAEVIDASSSSLRSLDCRATMCRIAVSNQDQNGEVKLLQHLVGDPTSETWSGAVYSKLEEDPTNGQPMMVAYVFRKGQGLPSEP